MAKKTMEDKVAQIESDIHMTVKRCLLLPLCV